METFLEGLPRGFIWRDTWVPCLETVTWGNSLLCKDGLAHI